MSERNFRPLPPSPIACYDCIKIFILRGLNYNKIGVWLPSFCVSYTVENCGDMIHAVCVICIVKCVAGLHPQYPHHFA